MSKWRRSVNAFIFIIYLKRFCSNVQKSRLILFDKFAKRYSHSLKEILGRMKESMNPFFKLVLMKHDIRF
jgi:hypothetical protein